MPSATAILGFCLSLIVLGTITLFIIPTVGTAFINSAPVLDSSSPFLKAQGESLEMVKTMFNLLPFLIALPAILIIVQMFILPGNTDTYETNNYPIETGSRSRRDTGEELAAIARRTAEETRQRNRREAEQVRQEQVQELSNLGINDITPEPQPQQATPATVEVPHDLQIVKQTDGNP